MNFINHRFDKVDKAAFRNGMSRLGSAVSAVTTIHENRRYGFTASAVCSVSDTPATLVRGLLAGNLKHVTKKYEAASRQRHT